MQDFFFEPKAFNVERLVN